MILNAQNFRTLTDGSERSLPPGSVGSRISCAHAGPDLLIQATVNGIRGEGGRNVGFAQVKMRTEPIPVDFDFVVAFRARAKSVAKWSVVLTTDVTERLDRERGDGAVMTFQAQFTPSQTETQFTLTISDFSAVIRGRELTGDYALTLEEPLLKTLGFQITRNAIAGGRDNLDPIEADLTILAGLLELQTGGSN